MHTRLPKLVRNFLFPRITAVYLLRVLLVAAATWFIFTRVVVVVRVHGISMEPTFHEGDIDICWRLRYAFREPARGDIVAVRFAGPHLVLLKRVVAIAGDTVAFHAGTLMLNGQPQPEPYLKLPSDWTLPPRTVAPGNVYVVGDNRSMDIANHEFGQTERKRVIGGVR